MKLQSSIETELLIQGGYLHIIQPEGAVKLTREQVEPIISEIRRLVKSRRQAAPKPTAVKPDDVTQPVWDDFMHIRRAKKAPLTDTALQGIRNEAALAKWSLEQVLKECVMRGWQGFKAEWVEAKVNVIDIARHTVPGKSERDPTLVRIEQERAKAAPIPENIRQQMAQLRGLKIA